jgi:sulfhydrogenase subunit beta (sulfur reductase)
MGKIHVIPAADWQNVILQLASEYQLYAPVSYNGSRDYELIDEDNAGHIIYNHPKPATPLKTFFLPVKENVTVDPAAQRQKIIMGIPACDLAALDILDEIYLEKDYTDIYYRDRRQNSILIGTDCHSILENCHCTSYDIDPVPGKNTDVIQTKLDDKIFLQTLSSKGEIFIDEVMGLANVTEADENDNDIIRIKEKRSDITESLVHKNRGLPGYESSGRLIGESDSIIWKSYSSTCVSCGACAVICPTCTCFLLIDRPDFEKVRQLDACQYPGFAMVAGDEDPLEELPVRFKNRYLCKYVWKPLKFKSLACTGCGRCIDSCLGKINKNELLLELAGDYNTQVR